MSLFDNYKKPEGFFGRIFLLYMNNANKKVADYGLNFLEFTPNLKILDIGCGGGANIKAMLSKSKNAHINGVDISELACTKARKYNKKNKNNVIIYSCDAHELPYNENSFDIVTALELVYIIEDIALFFKEVYRVLKSGGKFAVICKISDPRHKIVGLVEGFRPYTRKQLRDCLLSAGFKDIEIHYNEKHWVCAVGGK